MPEREKSRMLNGKGGSLDPKGRLGHFVAGEERLTKMDPGKTDK